MIKVKILKQIGEHQANEIIEVSEEKASMLCQPRESWDGEKLIKDVLAMKLEDWDRLQKAPLNKGGMTQGELEAMGLKNIVETPKDAAFERKLEKLLEPPKTKESKSKLKESA